MATDSVKRMLFVQASQHSSQTIAELYALRGMTDDPRIAECLELIEQSVRSSHRRIMALEDAFPAPTPSE
jgi:hypothetical protein